MVPLERIELSTPPLPRVCSTTEPQRRLKKCFRFGCKVSMFYLIDATYARAQMKNISKNDPPTLKQGGKKDDKARAKALRANLLKRKAQLEKRKKEENKIEVLEKSL